MERITDPTFEMWIAHHAEVATGQSDALWMAYDGEDSDMNPSTLAAYIARLYGSAAEALSPYEDATAARIIEAVTFDVNASLYDVFAYCPDDMALVAIIEVIPTLFRDFFSARLPRDGTLRSVPELPFERVTYMFFDSWMIRGIEAGHDLYRAAAVGPLLNAMEEVLLIDHEDAQCAAIHGLGHAHRAMHGERVGEIIDRFLSRNPPAGLREFAAQARRGEML